MMINGEKTSNYKLAMLLVLLSLWSPQSGNSLGPGEKTEAGLLAVGKHKIIRSYWKKKKRKTPQAKEKGRISVSFWDKIPHFSQKSAQPCQIYQNY